MCNSIRHYIENIEDYIISKRIGIYDNILLKILILLEY